ncbi:MAG: hypothetical protein ACI865_003222 [Flavobacteriaceae bacterium]|jgi:hypothetical protein
MKGAALIFLIIISSCSSGVDFRPVKFDNLLNDGNSKVWMINKMIVNKANVTSSADYKKELLIFYVNGSVQYLPMQDLGRQHGQVGSYILHSEEKKITFYFEETTWSFDLIEIEEDSVYMTPTPSSEVQFSIQIVPLPPILH